METIFYIKRLKASIFSYQNQQKWGGSYEIWLDQEWTNTRETGLWLTHLWLWDSSHVSTLLSSPFVLEFVFVFVPSNITWSSINKISLRRYWIPSKVYMLIMWLAGKTMWGPQSCSSETLSKIFMKLLSNFISGTPILQNLK